MIDQRVSRVRVFLLEKLYNNNTRQFVNKFNCKIVPVYVERIENLIQNWDYETFRISKNEKVEIITSKLNSILEKW